MSKIRIMLAEDHTTLREGLRLLLESDGDISVVAEAATGKEAIATALEKKPDVVLMDVALTGLDGIEATRRIHADMPSAAILMLSANAELFTVRASIEAGAIGYLIKRTGGKDLRDAVRAAASGRAYFSEEVTRAVRERVRPGRGGEPGRAEDPGAILTDRELEILQLIAAGNSNREIAEMLKLSVKTVETHRMHMMEKLDIHDVASLTRYALRKGLVDA